MKLQHIELNQLKLSPVNVRKRGAEEDLAELIASIRSLGLISPLLVRPNCEGFEVVAGQRRLLACQALHAETGKAEPVPCAVLENGDDAVALEASLAENVARLPMDEIDQYEAFAGLMAQGRSTVNDGFRLQLPEFLRVIEIPVLTEEVRHDIPGVFLGREYRRRHRNLRAEQPGLEPVSGRGILLQLQPLFLLRRRRHREQLDRARIDLSLAIGVEDRRDQSGDRKAAFHEEFGDTELARDVRDAHFENLR